MDVWRITVAVLRRWYVFFPLLALAGFGAFRVGEGVNPQYEVTATAILVPGPEESEIGSPYGNMNDTTRVLTIVLDANAARESIADRGLNPAYEIDARDRSSIVNVTVLTHTPEESLATVEAVLELTSQELAERQGAVGIPPAAQIGLQVLRAPSVSDVVTEGKTRNMAVVGIVGAGLSLLIAVLLDDLVGLLRRGLRGGRERKKAKTDEVESTEEHRPGAAEPDRQMDNGVGVLRKSQASETVAAATDVALGGEPDAVASGQNGRHMASDLLHGKPGAVTRAGPM